MIVHRKQNGSLALALLVFIVCSGYFAYYGTQFVFQRIAEKQLRNNFQGQKLAKFAAEMALKRLNDCHRGKFFHKTNDLRLLQIGQDQNAQDLQLKNSDSSIQLIENEKTYSFPAKSYRQYQYAYGVFTQPNLANDFKIPGHQDWLTWTQNKPIEFPGDNFAWDLIRKRFANLNSNAPLETQNRFIPVFVASNINIQIFTGILHIKDTVWNPYDRPLRGPCIFKHDLPVQYDFCFKPISYEKEFYLHLEPGSYKSVSGSQTCPVCVHPENNAISFFANASWNLGIQESTTEIHFPKPPFTGHDHLEIFFHFNQAAELAQKINYWPNLVNGKSTSIRKKNPWFQALGIEKPKEENPWILSSTPSFCDWNKIHTVYTTHSDWDKLQHSFISRDEFVPWNPIGYGLRTQSGKIQTQDTYLEQLNACFWNHTYWPFNPTHAPIFLNDAQFSWASTVTPILKHYGLSKEEIGNFLQNLETTLKERRPYLSVGSFIYDLKYKIPGTLQQAISASGLENKISQSDILKSLDRCFTVLCKRIRIVGIAQRKQTYYFYVLDAHLKFDKKEQQYFWEVDRTHQYLQKHPRLPKNIVF